MASATMDEEGQEAGPRRTCIACRKVEDKESLIRWVLGDDGHVVPDLLGRGFGRGAWIHPHPDCLKRLLVGLERSFKTKIQTTQSEAYLLLQQAGRHRTEQLLGSAIRQKQLVFGSDAVKEAWFAGRVALLLVAPDGRAALDASYVREAITAGKVQAWATKAYFGKLLGRSEVAVVAVVDRGLARRLFGAIAMALLVQDPNAASAAPGSENELFSEVE